MIPKKDLLKKLEKDNVKISDRMLTHFISLGLIKKPMRYGLGKGKGSVSEFDDRTFKDIKEIMKLREEGLTYEQIKQKRMSFDEWLSLVRQIKKSSKSAEDVTNSIKKVPYLANWEKGRLKLICDVAETLTKVFVSELSVLLSPYTNRFEEDLYDDAYEAIESYLCDLFRYGGIGWEGWEEELEEYLEDQGKKDRKSKKGDKHDNHDKK